LNTIKKFFKIYHFQDKCGLPFDKKAFLRKYIKHYLNNTSRPIQLGNHLSRDNVSHPLNPVKIIPSLFAMPITRPKQPVISARYSCINHDYGSYDTRVNRPLRARHRDGFIANTGEISTAQALTHARTCTHVHAHVHMYTCTHVHAFSQASLKSLPTMARDRRPSSSDNEQCWQRRCQLTPSAKSGSLSSATLSPLSILLRSTGFSLAVRPRKRWGSRADCTTVQRQLANPLTPTGWTLVKIPYT